MRYMLAMIGDEAAWQDMPPEQVQAFMEGVDAFNAKLRDAGAMVSGAGLQGRETAKTVRFGGDGPTVTDGPHSDARESLGGWWIVECSGVDEALEWARSIPLASGAIEVRPLVSE